MAFIAFPDNSFPDTGFPDGGWPMAGAAAAAVAGIVSMLYFRKIFRRKSG